MADTNIDIDDIPYSAPPSEEGHDFSHEGGEHEAFEGLAQQMADLSGCCYVDSRTHTDRIGLQNEHWGVQIEHLVSTYLDYRTQDGGNGMPSFLPSGEPTLDGCSPLFPTVTISIRTLAVYRQVHRTCPQFSIQAQCKALCHLHNFSDTYDIYLEILHHIDVLINQALNRNSPNWRLLNSCPCCFYKLEDEENMALEWLVTMDGNNSLK
ncbi:uncharacterized protein EDB93DRAFT_1091557 [Suillus bovinus]|uniref:uncharacterized protein n=1 Tax=Suillus bovinus TaxID=48563 RepID=UPI001B87A14F|nr:uncharacterized protein EDB93DRAFT_1091557 [Suillus bovinus]KAG2136551.1 hypothetical protein EDB93DRAFT_1091557 [Suillus bovinus]